MRILVAVQILALVVVALLTAAKVREFQDGDEPAHYDYVQTIAEQGRLPVITDTNHDEVRAIFTGVYPASSPVDPSRSPLERQSYEAFQPPLYYLTAVPAFAAVADHEQKVLTVRLFDAGLILVAAGLLLLLARAVRPERSLAGLAGALSVLLWPGLVARAVTVSPSPLELVAVAGLSLVLWRVLQGGGRRDVIAAGVVLGLCLLTKSTLVYMAPLWLLVVATDLRRRRDWIAAAASAAVVVVLLVPWLAFNHAHYGSLTATEQAQAQQRVAVNPGFEDYGVGDVFDAAGKLPDSVIPGEWSAQRNVWWVGGLAIVLFVALPVAWLATVVRTRSRAALYAGAPLVSALAILAVTMAGSDWPVLIGRYLFAALPVLGVGVAVTLSERRALWLTGGLTAGAFALWFDVAGAFFFTNVGDALGI